MSDALAPVDPAALMRSRQYRVLLVLAALVGLRRLGRVVVLPRGCPRAAGLGVPGSPGRPRLPRRPGVVAAAVGRPRRAADRRSPWHGCLDTAATYRSTASRPAARRPRPIDLPGVLLAALATLGLGLVLGPEGPLIALGLGLGTLAMRLVKRDAPRAGRRPDGAPRAASLPSRRSSARPSSAPC